MWGYQAVLRALEGRGYKFKVKPASMTVFFFSCVDAVRSTQKIMFRHGWGCAGVMMNSENLRESELYRRE